MFTITLQIEFARFPSNLAETGPIVKKWQQFFKIQDGGGRHLDFGYICIFDITVAFHVRFATFSINLLKIGSTVKKWQMFFRIQDGGRHL